MSETKSLVDVILGFGNAFAGVCDFLEQVEEGEEPVRAAKRAYRRVKKRAIAVKKTKGTGKLPFTTPEERVREERRKRVSGARVERDEEGGVVIDVTPIVGKGVPR